VPLVAAKSSASHFVLTGLSTRPDAARATALDYFKKGSDHCSYIIGHFSFVISFIIDDF